MKNYIILFSILVCFSMCKTKSEKQKSCIVEKNKENFNYSDTISCENSVFYKCISNYIVETKGRVPTTKYYSVFFFEEDKQNFFTIWFFTLPVHLILEDEELFKYNYLYDNIMEYDVVFVNAPDNDLIKPCRRKLKDISELKIENNFPDYYDGSWFPKTFRYYYDKENFLIEDAEEVITDFFVYSSE